MTRVTKAASGFKSQPTKRRPAARASTADVPPPMNGSRIVSPGRLNPRRRRGRTAARTEPGSDKSCAYGRRRSRCSGRRRRSDPAARRRRSGPCVAWFFRGHVHVPDTPSAPSGRAEGEGTASIVQAAFAECTRIPDTVATVVTGFRIGASTVKGFERPGAFGGPLFAVHVQGESLFDVPLGPHAVDALLRLAETPVASLHCVACCPQQLIVQIQQRLLQVRAVQHGQRSGQPLETPHPLTQLLQTPQRRGRLAAAVKQPIHLVHDVAQDT